MILPVDHTLSESLGKILKSLTPTAMTNARFTAFHGVSVALAPLDQTRSTPQIARSSRVDIGQSRSSGVLPSGDGGQRFAPASFR